MISKETPERSGVFLCLEFGLLYGAVPLLVLAARRPGVLVLLLWLGALVTCRASRVQGAGAKLEWGRVLRRLSLVAPLRIGILLWLLAGERSEAERQARRVFWGIIGRFAVCGAVLTLATWWVFPGLFLSLPRMHPVFWIVIMVLYPLLSVWPQEVIFRRFLFFRYRRVFGESGVVAASALAFGFAHVIFLNWVAVALTIAGGAMFARNYARNRSLWLACFEHGLYGCLVFTIGLGRFFYTGAAWHH